MPICAAVRRSFQPRRAITVVLALAAGAWTAACGRAATDGPAPDAPAPPAPTAPSLPSADAVHPSVVVIDTLGRPVAGAEVRLVREDGPGARVTTNADGIADVGPAPRDGRPAGVSVRAAGFGAATREVGTSPWTDAESRVRIVLRPAHPLRGRVLGPDELPVAGVVVEDRSTDLRTGFGEGIVTFRPGAATGPDGTFEIDGLAEGTADLVVRTTGGGWFLGPTIAVPNVHEIDLRVPDVLPIEGSVVSAEDGLPLADADVVVRAASGVGFIARSRTDAGGRFRVPAVPRAELVVSAHFRERLPGEAAVPAPDEHGFGVVRVAVPRGATVRGRVTCGRSPLAGADVEVDPESAPAVRCVTGTDGRFEVRGLPAGPARVEASAFGHRSAEGEFDATRDVTLTSSAPTDADLELVALPVVTLRGCVEGPDGPVSGATVRVSLAPPGLHVLTSADGRFVITGPVDDTFDLELTAPGFDTEWEWVRPDEKHGTWPDEIVVRMEREFVAVVRGVVRTADGAPLRNARVSLVSESQFGGWNDDEPVAPDGTFEIRTSYRGDFHVAAEDSGHAISESASFTLGPDEPAPSLRIVLAKPFAVRGRVVARGIPVARARILRRDGSTVLATTDASGDFAIPCLAPAKDDAGPLVVRAPGIDDVPLSRGDGDGTGAVLLDVDPIGTLDVEVTDDSGAPVPGARVRVVPAHHLPLLDVPSRMPGLFGATTAIGIGGSVDSESDPQTGADGRARVTGLPAVPLRMRVLAPEGDTALRRTTVVESVAPGTTAVRVVLHPGKAIRGRVTDVAGRPVAGAFVSGEGRDDAPEATTGADGGFEIAGLGDDPRLVVVHPPEGARLRRTRVADVVPGGPEVAVRLEPTLSISGRLVNAEGQAVAGVGLAAVAAGRPRDHLASPDADARSDDAGRFRIDVERPGAWRLVVVSSRDDVVVRDVIDADSVAADTDGLRVLCVEVPPVGGIVTGPDGEPCDFALVRVRVEGDPDREVAVAITDEGGRFSARVRRAGPITVVASAAGRAAVAVVAPPERGDVKIALTAAELTVSGHVLEPDGSPSNRVRLVLTAEDRPGLEVACQTESDGSFVAEHLSPGRWRVSVVQNAYTAEEFLPLGVVDAGARDVELTSPRDRR